MAANKFATMLHRNTNKITLILVYAILEWVLILLLLLNSFFSFLIVKYAEYFGLKRPCLWCTRLDHIFDSSKKKNSYRDLVCDDHATEISKLGFCSNHRRLSESRDMCEDCSSSSLSQPDCHELSKNYAFFPWMRQIGMLQGSGEVGLENGEVDSKCSCCSVSLEEEKRKLYSPYLLIQPSWEVLDYTQKGNLIKEEACGIDGGDDHSDHSDHSRSSEDVQRIEGTELEAEENCSFSVSNSDEKVDSVTEKEEEPVKEDDLACDQTTQNQVSCDKDLGIETAPKHIEFYIEGEDFHLIPVEMMDPSKPKNTSGYEFGEESQEICGNEDVILDFSMHDVGTQVESVVENNSSTPGEAVASLSAHETEDAEQVNESEWSEFIQAESEQPKEEEHQQVAVTENTQTPSTDDVQEMSETARGDMESDNNQVCSDDVLLQLQSEEVDAEISIGTEIPEHEPIDDIHTQEILPSSSELQADNDDHGCKQTEADIEFRTIPVETSERAIDSHLSVSSEINEIEEEKAPDTPTSTDSLHQLDKKLLLLERRESGTEESLDGGSVFSDIDGSSDGTLTVEKLKSALRAERKALNALYSELEEERSASAVAANQTMAMINRLQEEKAAMQMEALQYQRMMEEQSEYDQEALQLLNELMVKREREKAEIEKELELYRRKVQDYEAKEKIIMLRRRSRTSSVSCSNAEDSDGLSIDLNHDAKDEDSFENHDESSNQNTPADAVLYLEESLANFEEERLIILEQLKGLEEKLVTLHDEEEQHFEDIKPIDHFYKENGNGYNEHHDFSIEGNGIANGHFKEINGRLLPERKIIGAKAKRLLPLFDAETEDGILNGNELEFDTVASQNSSVTKSELDTKRHAFEEEVDHVYERLQALEADREFLRHCISSLRKGDKGLYVLQEILQHLRDLRNVELRAKNFGDFAS